MLCLVDLSKCFDVINHDILISKLRLYGIETSWFAAYLQGHTQSVSLYDGSSRKVLPDRYPTTWVSFRARRSVHFFSQYSLMTYDLSLYTGDAVAFQYADDTQILVSGPRNDLRGLTSRMEASLSSLNVWFSSHALKVNATKTQLMVFGSRQNLRNLPDFKISFRDTELQPCAQVGNLGVVFDGTLSWEAQVSELSRRCMGVLIGLSHARQCLPDGVLKGRVPPS